MNKKEKNNNLTKEITLLQQITNTLKQTNTNNITQQITQYGTINYTRTQYLPQLSKKITENPQHNNKFYNYTSIETMINDLLEIIEYNTINTIETQTQQEKTKQMIQYTTKLLKLLEKTLTTTNHQQITQQIQKTQTQYYQLTYNEKTNPRIK